MPQVAGQVKVLIGELDGSELEPEERLLVKDDLAFGETGDSQKVFETSGIVTAVEFYHSTTQTTANRKARVDITYDTGLPTIETWKYYGADGTTVKRTVTLTHTWASGSLTKTEESVA